MDCGIPAVIGQTDHDTRNAMSPYPGISLLQHTHARTLILITTTSIPAIEEIMIPSML